MTYFKKSNFRYHRWNHETVPDTDGDENAQQLNDPFSDQEIKIAINKMKIGKSPGPDGLGAIFFRNTITELVPFLTNIFNSIFDSGTFPKNVGDNQ